MYGSVSSQVVATSDSVAPDAPAIVSALQKSNSQIDVTVSLPSADADGSQLSGLKRVDIATAPVGSEGANPFEGKAWPEIAAMDGVVLAGLDITPEAAGTQVKITIPVLNLGGSQAIAAACSD
jgi:hypothetical protein